MGGYKPPFIITNKILSYVSSISEKIGQITATSNLEAKPHLRRNNMIKSFHSSLKIEANSLTFGQVRDGNGRVARLWHTAILSKWKPIFEYIPIENQIEKFQGKYYEAISGCHVAGESTIFIEFILSQIDKLLDDVSVQASEKNGYLSEAVQKLLEVMEYDVPYTGNALMERLGLKAKEGFRRNSLHPAVEMNLIQMTIPDKPNSRNQRYVRTRYFETDGEALPEKIHGIRRESCHRRQ